ncbi:hypothetical protein [Mesorhizobium tamadayense]|uniref:hypothetical protein n=1 Tax=Mesorhizobium tamadayense TaxID=425306 RepID=UPI00142D4DB5|nr:hypothetical protein [Mesorhizobium tamadayense]
MIEIGIILAIDYQRITPPSTRILLAGFGDAMSRAVRTTSNPRFTTFPAAKSCRIN